MQAALLKTEPIFMHGTQKETGAITLLVTLRYVLNK